MNEHQLNFPALVKWAAALLIGMWMKTPSVIRFLMAFMVIDYASGLAVAYMRKELCSDIGRRGLVKKLLSLLFLLAVHVMEQATGLNVGIDLDSTIAVGFALNEAISIVENCARAGVPIPAQLVTALINVKRIRGVAPATPEQLAQLEREQPSEETMRGSGG